MEPIGWAELPINLRFLHYLATMLEQSCVAPVCTVWSKSPNSFPEIAVLRRISLELRACPPLWPMWGCCGAQREKCVIPSKKDGEIRLSLAFLGEKSRLHDCSRRPCASSSVWTTGLPSLWGWWHLSSGTWSQLQPFPSARVG